MSETVKATALDRHKAAIIEIAEGDWSGKLYVALKIASPFKDEGISIFGFEAVKKLRDFLDENLKEFERKIKTVKECATCKGKGTVLVEESWGVQTDNCPDCGGSGFVVLDEKEAEPE